MALVALKSGARLGSAAVLGASAAFVGIYVYRVNHPAVFTLGYAPWILLGWLFVAGSGERRGVRLVGPALIFMANACLLVSGTVKEAAVLCGGLNAVGLCLAAIQCGDRARWVQAGSGGIAALAGILVTAPSWLVFLETLGVSDTPYLTARTYQIPPGLLLGFFDEIFYRPLQAGERVSNGSANVLFLAGVAFLAANPKAAAVSRSVKACACGAAGFGALAFGLVPGAWIEALPLVRGISHLDNCATLALVVLLGPVAAAGLDAARTGLAGTDGGRQLGRAAALMLAIGVVWIGTVQALPKVLPGVLPTTIPIGRNGVSPFVWASLPLLVGAAIGGLWLLRLTVTRRIPRCAGGPLMMACLWILLWRHGLHVPTAFDDYVVNPPPRSQLFGESAAVRAVRLDAREPWRVVGTGGGLNPGWAAVYGLETISGPDALMNPRYRELTDALGMERFLDWRLIVEPASFSRLRSAYNLLGVRYLLDAGEGRAILEAETEFVGRWDLDVYRNPTAWPRAFLVPHVFTFGSLADLAELSRIQPGPFAAMRLGEENALGLPVVTREHPPPPAIPATAYELGTNRTAFTVVSAGPGVAVLHESWLPTGLSASVNGEAARVFPINHAFRGVRIPEKGTWRVEFSYRPRSHALAIWVALAGLALGASTLVLAAFGGPRRPVER